MVSPLITARQVTTPVTTATRRRINETYILMGVATGGNVNTALPINTPRRFHNAPVRAAAATGAAITAGVAAGDWSVVFNEAVDRAITNTLDFYLREGWSHVDVDVIVVRVEQTGAAPPTTAQWNAAIASLPLIRTLYPTLHPSAVIVPDFEFVRDGSSPYAAATPPTAIPWLARLDSAAEDLGATVILGTSPSFTRSEMIVWAAANYQSDVALTAPGARGEDATAAKAYSSAASFVWSMLEREEDGIRGHVGRGVPLFMMPAEGINGIVPSITQSIELESTDDFLLNQAGINALVNYGGRWRWKGDYIGKDFSSTPPNPLTDILSVKRYARTLQTYMEGVVIDAIVEGLRGDEWFNHVIQTGNAHMTNDVAAGKIQSGEMFRLDPPVNPATTARIGYRFAPYHPFISAELEGHIELPTFAA